MASRQRTHFRREAATRPGSPGPAAQNDISPVLARGARPKNAGGASGGGCLGAGVSPSTRSLAVPRGPHVPDCLPTAVGTVQKRCCWACGCVQMSVRACGGLCVGGAAAPGKWRGAGSGLRLWGFRWSLRTCGWLSICLPLLVAFCFLSLHLTYTC